MPLSLKDFIHKLQGLGIVVSESQAREIVRFAWMIPKDDGAMHDNEQILTTLPMPEIELSYSIDEECTFWSDFKGGNESTHVEPETALSVCEPNYERGEILYQKAKVLQESNMDLHNARAVFIQAISLVSNSVERLAILHNALAINWILEASKNSIDSKSSYLEGFRHSEIALFYRPLWEKALITRAMCCEGLGEVKEAIESYRAALSRLNGTKANRILSRLNLLNSARFYDKM